LHYAEHACSIRDENLPKIAIGLLQINYATARSFNTHLFGRAVAVTVTTITIAMMAAVMTAAVMAVAAVVMVPIMTTTTATAVAITATAAWQSAY
jgi:hypothetical protein